MKVLSVDPGSKKFGLALFEWEDLLLSSQNPVSTKIRKIERIEYVCKVVTEYIISHSPDLVVIEESGIARSKHIWLVIGIVQQIIEDCKNMWIRTETLSPSTVKKHVAWKGNADKSEVELAVCELFPGDYWEDEADAIAIWYTYLIKSWQIEK